MARCVALALGVLLGMMCGGSTYAFEGTGDASAAAKSIPEPIDAAVRERERRALIDFYEALGGPDWIERDFWGSDRPVGEWHGVRPTPTAASSG